MSAGQPNIQSIPLPGETYIVQGLRQRVLGKRWRDLLAVFCLAALAAGVFGIAAGKYVLLYYIWVPLLLFAATLRGKELPRLRLESEALYVEGDGGKTPCYWNDIGPAHFDKNLRRIWWRTAEEERAISVSGQDPNLSSGNVTYLDAGIYFENPELEGAAFANKMNAWRAKALD